MEMDHQRPPDGFVHQATHVAAVHPPGAAPTVRASRRRCGAADLNVDDVIHLEHAVDTQPGQVRKQTKQTQTSTSGARVPWGACAGQVYRKSADGRHDSRARATFNRRSHPAHAADSAALGKNVAAFWQAGGQVRDWVRFELARLRAAGSDPLRPADLRAGATGSPAPSDSRLPADARNVLPARQATARGSDPRTCPLTSSPRPASACAPRSSA